MLDVIFILSLLLGYVSIKSFADWCEKQIIKK